MIVVEDGVAVDAVTKQEVVVPGTLSASIAAARRQGTGKYATTVDNCMCADHQYRKRLCKHMRALREGKNADGEQPTSNEDDTEDHGAPASAADLVGGG